MLGSSTLGARPLSTAEARPQPYKLAAVVGEFGWTSWAFSRQAKLNAWAWHGLGGANVLAWATLGNSIYLRNDIDTFVHVAQPDTFFSSGETNTESVSVEATTQWLDFGKPGKMKALTGIDFDGQNVTAIEVYVSVNGGRTGSLAASIPIGENNGGWTYNGEVIPLEEVGAATEFMLRMVCDPNLEAQINKLTLYWDDVSG